MARFVYITESLGDETGFDMAFSTPGKAIARLKEYYGRPIPRGSVAELKGGKMIFATDPEDGSIYGCAMKVRVR